MKLEEFFYSEFIDTDNEWKLENCGFQDVNLIVGRNAIGKTRTLNVINNLALLLSETDTLKWKEGKFQVQFLDNNQKYFYVLEYHDGKVCDEELRIDNVTKLKRNISGEGFLYAEKEAKNIEFKTEQNRIAASIKRDSIQHTYLSKLFEWASGLGHFGFNTRLGKDKYAVKVADSGSAVIEPKISIKESDKAIEKYLSGKQLFGKIFDVEIIEDMKFLDYDVTDIGVTTISGLKPAGSYTPTLNGLFVQEADLFTKTEQFSMSEGMFRALSVLIQINYALLSFQATCVLIDDIGEGLDYGRSTALVKRLIEKAKGSSIQLIMSTNDRFIMNAVPLEHWIVLVRKGGNVKNLNYLNSKELFDRFEQTGLNNFDFFSSEYYLNRD